MLKQKGDYHVATAPLDSRMTPILAQGSGETLQQIYNRLDPKPAILINGNMFNMTTRQIIQGLKIGNNIISKANYGGHLLIAENGKYRIEKHPNILANGDWALEGTGMIKPRNVVNINSAFITGKHERMSVGLSKDSIVVVATTSEVTFDELEQTYDGEKATTALNLDGGDSVGLIYAGKTIINSSRKIMNAIAIYGQETKVDKINLAFVGGGHEVDTKGKETPYIESLKRQIKENEFNDPVAAIIVDELKRHKVNTHLIAPGPLKVSLPERTDYANQIYKEYCDKYGKENVNAVYVSIHFNAIDGRFDGPSKDPSGFSTHVYPGHKNKAAGQLARSILDELKNGTKQINRGIVEQDLHITRETHMVAVLTENGFMDNEREAMLMLNPEFQNEVGTETARGILKYFGMAYIDKVADNVEYQKEIAWLNVKIVDLENLLQRANAEKVVAQREATEKEQQLKKYDQLRKSLKEFIN